MPDNVRGWLYRVAANAVISRSRRGLTLNRLLPRLLDRGEPERPEGGYLRSERESALGAEVPALRPLGSAAVEEAWSRRLRVSRRRERLMTALAATR